MRRHPQILFSLPRCRTHPTPKKAKQPHKKRPIYFFSLTWGEFCGGEGEKSAGALKVEEKNSAYGEDVLTTLPEDFQHLTPRHKMVVCEIVHALLRAEKQ